jgi:hypothetical protein
MRVLLDGGADVSLRCSGYNAAGHLFCAFEKENLDRERRLTTMRVLLEKGADVNEPFREHFIFSGSRRKDCVLDYVLNCSDETLLDKAYLAGDSELAGLFEPFGVTSESLLTISGIVFNAQKGIQELQAYLRIASFPRGLRRRRMQELSLRRCFGKPKAFSTMLQAGFDLRLPHLRDDILDIRQSRFSSFRSSPKRVPKVRSIVIEVFENMQFMSLPKDIISLILQKDTELKAGLTEACLDTGCKDDLEYLLNSGLDVTKADGVILMAEVA